MQSRDSISRRQMLGATGSAAALAMVGGVRAGWAQAAKRIDQFAPELEKIISLSEPIQELANGLGGELGPAEGPVWWKEGGYLLFSDIHNNKRMKYAPGQGVSVFKEPTNRANGLTRDLQGRLLACEHDSRRVTRLVSCSQAINLPCRSRVRPLARFVGSRKAVTPAPGSYFIRRLLWMSLNSR